MSKLGRGTPFFRQDELAHGGFPLDRGTMSRWAHDLGVVVSKRVVACAARALMAHDLGASVHARHVVDGEPAIAPAATTERREARELDRALAATEAKLGARFTHRTEHGDPLRTILERATDYDMIVIGTHGRVGRLHELIGSITEAVVRSAPCPVLTVREPSGEESFAERRHGRKSIAEQVE